MSRKPKQLDQSIWSFFRHRKLRHICSFLVMCSIVSSIQIRTDAQDNQGLDQFQNQELDIPDENQEQDLPQLLIPHKELPVIDEELASWHGAESGTARFGSGIRSNWVMLNQEGSVTGNVTGLGGGILPELQVYVLRNGFVVGETATDKSGKFKLEGLKTGAYTIVGYHQAALFCFGFIAIDYRANTQNIPTSISTKAIASNQNKILTGEAIGVFSAEVKFPVFGKYVTDEADISHASHFGWQGFSEFDVESIAASTIKSETIQLGSNGKFSGRIHQLNPQNGRPVGVNQTKVILISNGQRVAETKCNRKGVFEVSGLSEGEYGLIAAGEDGFAAIGIKLVETGSSAKNTAVDLTLIQPESIGWLNHFVTNQLFAEDRAQPRPYADDGYGRGYGPGYVGNQGCSTCFRVYVNSRPSCSCGR